MINTATAVKAPSVPAEYSVEQHTVSQTLLLHLLPGALIPMVYLVRGKKNIYISMLAHCLKNTIGTLLMISLFFKLTA